MPRRSPVPTESYLTHLARTIQLSVAPVFLLTAIGTTLAVLTNRLSRIVDRARILEERLATISENEGVAVHFDDAVCNTLHL